MKTVDDGGRFIRQSEIGKMTVGQLLELLVPNNVEFNIKHKMNEHNKGTV